MTLMEVSSTPATSIFSLHVLIILGITVALVGAVTVILYNKIQQQGEKLSAVMELSAVLAQEVRSHDTVLKHLHSREPPSQQSRHTNSSLPSPPLNIVFNSSDNDPVRVYVSDGSGSSDDDESVEEVSLNISQIPSTTLDTMLMNPMCFGHVPGITRDTDRSDSDESDESGSGDESNIDDNTDDESCNTLSVLSNHLESVIDLDEEDVEEIIEINISDNSPSEKRVITLSDISIDASNEEVCSDVHKVVVDSGDNVLDYKKLSVNELRRLAIERKLLDKGSKMKKGPLIDLLTNV
jgi:hypothetical protein